MSITTQNQPQGSVSHFNEEQKNCIKNLLCKGITDDELYIFTEVCKRCKLDPFARQIYAVKRGGQMTIQTSIDGLRLIAERSKQYMPGPEPTYTYNKNNILLSVTAYVKKLAADGSWHIIAATAFFDEYVQPSSPIWKKMPRCMLAKCAESLAIRKGFPADCSGIYTEEEMEQAENRPKNADSITIEVPHLGAISNENAIPVIHYPTVIQCKELDAILNICPADFVKLIHDEMAEMECMSFADLPIEQYEKIKTAANKVKKAVH